MQDFTDRLNEIKQMLGGTNVLLGKAMSVSSVAAGNYSDGKRYPDAVALSNLFKSNPEISAEWLFKGTGSMLVSDNSSVVVNMHKSSNSGIIGNGNSANGAAFTVKPGEYDLDRFISKEQFDKALDEYRSKIDELVAQNMKLVDKLLTK